MEKGRVVCDTKRMALLIVVYTLSEATPRPQRKRTYPKEGRHKERKNGGHPRNGQRPTSYRKESRYRVQDRNVNYGSMEVREKSTPSS